MPLKQPVKLAIRPCKRWDLSDIQELLDAAVDGFACEFYARPFDELSSGERRRTLAAIAAIARQKRDAH